MQYHEYIRQNGRKPAAQSYRACKIAASCTFRTDYAFLWAQAVLFCWVHLKTWVLRTLQKKESIGMRTKKLRLVSALLALAMLFVMMPVGAFADNVYPVSGNCGATGGDNITWKVEQNGDTANDGEQGWTLTLTGNGAMADYNVFDSSHRPPWYWAHNEITQVSIPQGVTHIGDYAFSGIFNPQEVDIPDGVETIGDYSFEGCFGGHGKTKLVLPDSVIHIGEGAFEDCTFLQNVTLSKNLTDIGNIAFANCTALQEIQIPAGVKTIGAGAFFDCPDLKRINIPNGVTSIEMGTFHGCIKLESIDIPDSVTTIGDDAFVQCFALKEITIPQQVETIGERAFATCAQLEKIDIAKGSNLTEVKDHAFETTNYYSNGQYYGKLSDMMDDLAELGINELAETKIYCGAPLKKSGKLSDKGVAEKNIIASVTVKLVDGEQTKTWNVPYGETVGTLEKPIKEGYTFVDWYDEKGNVFDPTAPLTEDTTIHAEWKKDAAPAPTPTPAPAPAPAPVDDDSVDAGAVAATVVLGAGTAALAYHIGTELYAEQVLGKGVVVPTLRGDVARKAWELAGKPAVTVAGNEAPDEDAQAQQWVVDQGLMKDRKDGKFHPEQWMSKLKALRTLDAAKKLG